MYKGVAFILLILTYHHISVVGKDGEDGSVELIRREETLEDLLVTLTFEPDTFNPTVNRNSYPWDHATTFYPKWRRRVTPSVYPPLINAALSSVGCAKKRL
jgi:hypothetical protein